MSAGDLQFIHDGKASKWVNFPVGFQVGKVLKLGQLPVRFSVNPQYHLLDRDGSSKWSVGLTFTALFPSTRSFDTKTTDSTIE